MKRWDKDVSYIRGHVVLGIGYNVGYVVVYRYGIRSGVVRFILKVRFLDTSHISYSVIRHIIPCQCLSNMDYYGGDYRTISESVQSSEGKAGI